MAIPIPVPDTHPGVDWQVASTDEIEFVFSEDVDDFEVEYPDDFKPKVKSGPHKKGTGPKHKPKIKNKKVHFTYRPDNSSLLAGTHTILIGN